MSGGRYEYKQGELGRELFGWCMSVDYGDDGFNQSKMARKINPMGDREISEIVWDVLCLVHSRDWNESGDTCDETYIEDVKRFKDKWFNRTDKDRAEAYRDDLQSYYEELRDEMLRGRD